MIFSLLPLSLLSRVELLVRAVTPPPPPPPPRHKSGYEWLRIESKNIGNKRYTTYIHTVSNIMTSLIPTLRGIPLPPSTVLIPPSSFVPIAEKSPFRDSLSTRVQNRPATRTTRAVREKENTLPRKKAKKQLQKKIREWKKRYGRLLTSSVKKKSANPCGFKDEMNTIQVKNVIGFNTNNPQVPRFEDCLLAHLEDLSKRQLLGFGVYFIPTVVAYQESDLTPHFVDSIQVSGMFSYLPQITDIGEVKEALREAVQSFSEIW